MKTLVFISLTVLFVHGNVRAQIEMVNRNDLLKEKDLHSAVPVAIADMNHDGLDDIVTLDVGRRLIIQYQTPDPNRPFVRYEVTRNVDNAEQNDICVADFNNDGYRDILTVGSYDRVKVFYAIPFSYQYNLVYINVVPFFSQGASTGDFNQDGWVDVVLLNDNGANYTLLNDGAGNLEVQDLFDWNTVPSSDNSGNYGSVYTDFDMDGDLDFYIAKCRQGVNSPSDPRRINVMHENDGTGQYTENAARYGLAVGRQTWTADFGDMDNDGDLDCFMTQHDVISELYENIDNDTFINITASAGLDIGGIPLQGMFRDFDNDGFQDILVSGDRVDFYRNNGDKTFSRQNTFGTIVFGSFGLGDLNNDGFTDVYASRVIPFNNPDLLREDILYITTTNDNNWISLDISNGTENTAAIGAMALLYGEWGTQIREVRGGEQYGVSNSHKMIFGLGEATTYDSLVIRWPDGTREHFDFLAVNSNYIIKKGGCHQPQVSHFETFDVLCENDSIQLNSGWDAGILHSVIWSNGQTTDTISVTEAGLYFPVIVGGFNPCPLQYLPIEIANDQDTIKPTIAYDGMTSLCRGDVAVLQLPDALGYAWSSGQTTQQIEVVESGSYAAEVQGYCKQQSSDTITFEFLVPAVPVGESDTFTTGEAAELFAAGDSIIWYSDANGLNVIGTGNTLVLNDLTETTVVYAQNHAAIAGSDFEVGPVTQAGGNKYNATFVNGGQIFSVEEPLVLHQVTIYTDSIGQRIITITGTGGYSYTKTVDLVDGTNIIVLDAVLPPGEYTLSTDTDNNVTEFGVNSPYLWRSSDNVDYPYEVQGILSITNSTYGEDFFYYFYDWKISTQPRYCTSVLEPVTAFFDKGVAVYPLAADRLNVDPNPTSGIVSVTLPNAGDVVVDIVSVDGSVVYTAHRSVYTGNTLELDLHDLQSGVYALRIFQAGVTHIGKIVRL